MGSHDAEEELQIQVLELEAEVERLRAALQSIANNTCCDGCQEAARVAAKALRGGDDDDRED